MSKKTIKIFTITGIISVIFRLASIVCSYNFSDYRWLSFSLDMAGQLLFLSLLVFVARDLQINYGKSVRPVYLFIFSMIFLSVMNVIGIEDTGIIIFIQLLFFVVMLVFIIHIIRTVYRLFAIVLIISILLSALLRYIVSKYLSDGLYQSFLLLGILPALFPLVLIYIVYTKENTTLEEEINSIGNDIPG